MGSSVKETCFHVQSVCRTISAMARLPGSHTPVTTSSTKPVQPGADAPPAKPAWVQNNDRRYVDNRITKTNLWVHRIYHNLKHADILHNFFKWYNQVKRIVFPSESDCDKKGFWNATRHLAWLHEPQTRAALPWPMEATLLVLFQITSPRTVLLVMPTRLPQVGLTGKNCIPLFPQGSTT